MRGLVAWCYNLKYDGQAAFSANSPAFHSSFADPRKAADYAKYLISLYAAAGKYQMWLLSYSIDTHLLSVLNVAVQVTSTSMHIDQVVRHLYLDTAEAAATLRPKIVLLFVRAIKSFSDLPAFAQLLLDVPEFAADMVLAFAAKTVGDVPNSIDFSAKTDGNPSMAFHSKQSASSSLAPLNSAPRATGDLSQTANASAFIFGSTPTTSASQASNSAT